MSFRTACVSLLLTVACGVAAPPNTAASGTPALGSEPAQFAWDAPFSVHVSEASTRDKTNATLSYWLDVCPRAPDDIVVAYRDFHFVTLMGKPAASPEFAPLLAQLTPVMSALPRFTVDARGDIVAVEGLPDLIARLRTSLPSADLDALQKLLDDPNIQAATLTAAVERWNVWVRAWLTVDPRTISAKDIITPHRVKLTRSAHDKAIPDPAGSGATLDIDVALTTDTQWPAIRPWTATSDKTVRVTLNGEHATRSETHRYTFDWAAEDRPVPDCTH